MSALTSTFAWIDHSETERRRMLDALEMFRDRGTRDELGLSSIRDGFADLMFPGTGSLHTRARYFFFVPWMYRLLEEERVSSAEMPRKARQFEVKLINALDRSEDKKGVIGIQKRAALQRMPSSIYWNGLKRLGIRLFGGAQHEYHKTLDAWYKAGRRSVKNDDDEFVGRPGPNWHPGLPATPAGFPERAELRMTAVEADYLRERILVQASASLFGFVADRVKAESEDSFIWEHALASELPPQLSKQVWHARLFAEAMQGASIVYNLLLAEMEPRREELLPELTETFELWRADVLARLADLQRWDRGEMWEMLRLAGAGVTAQTRDFVETWVSLLLEARDPGMLLRSEAARDLISRRERRLKRNLARLHNPNARERWNGNSGLGRMDYRWRNAQTVLNDMIQAG
jgi:hypothetical protein